MPHYSGNLSQIIFIITSVIVCNNNNFCLWNGVLIITKHGIQNLMFVKNIICMLQILHPKGLQKVYTQNPTQMKVIRDIYWMLIICSAYLILLNMMGFNCFFIFSPKWWARVKMIKADVMVVLIEQLWLWGVITHSTTTTISARC